MNPQALNATEMNFGCKPDSLRHGLTIRGGSLWPDPETTKNWYIHGIHESLSRKANEEAMQHRQDIERANLTDEQINQNWKLNGLYPGAFFLYDFVQGEVHSLRVGR